MLERTYTYKGYTIEQYLFGERRFFYPSFNGNAEFTSIRDCVKFLKTIFWLDNLEMS